MDDGIERGIDESIGGGVNDDAVGVGGEEISILPIDWIIGGGTKEPSSSVL